MTGYLRTWRPIDATRPLLLCLPQAGAGAGGFQPWVTRHPGVDVVAVLLPGREQRFVDPPAVDVEDVVSHVVAELDAVLAGQPLIVFGDSFGGLLGYELAGRLPARALVVAACRAPRWWSGAGRGITRDDVTALVAARTAAIDLDEDSSELLTEILLADAELSNTYRANGARLSCAIHAWGGRTDTTVTAAQLDDWAEVADAGVYRRDFDAGHDLVRDCAEVVAAAIEHIVTGAIDDVFAATTREAVRS